MLMISPSAQFVVPCSHFVEDWVRIGYPAKKKVQTECASLSVDDQCYALEKVHTTYLPTLSYYCLLWRSFL